MNFGIGDSGQSWTDRALAAKHTVVGDSLAKVVCKATTEEIKAPKRKHVEYLIHCTNDPNVSIPQMANHLIERTQNSSWVVVYKSLVTVHNLMILGNERFLQYFASNNCCFSLASFTDRTSTQGYDMSLFIRSYSRYLNEKAFSYRQLGFDICRIKRGKNEGLMRLMSSEKLLKALPVAQSQLDALLAFQAKSLQLTNGIINASFMMLFKDVVRLFASYNDGIINLLDKYFDMNKKNCHEAFDIYKMFISQTTKVSEFLKVAEDVGIDKGEIPDLTQAPSSLLDALSDHLSAIENPKKPFIPSKPSEEYATVSRIGQPSQPEVAKTVAAPLAAPRTVANRAEPTSPSASKPPGSVLSITEEDRQRILEEEQKQLDEILQKRIQKLKNDGQVMSTQAMNVDMSPSSDIVDGFVHLHSNSAPRLSEDLFSLSDPVPFTSYNAQKEMYNPFLSSDIDPVLLSPSNQMFDQPTFSSYQMLNSTVPPTLTPALTPTPSILKPTVTPTLAPTLAPVPVLPATTPQYSFPPVSSPPVMTKPQAATRPVKLVSADLDESLSTLAGNINIDPLAHVRKDQYWNGPPTEKRLTGDGQTFNAAPFSPVPSGYPVQMMPMGPPLSPYGMQLYPAQQPTNFPYNTNNAQMPMVSQTPNWGAFQPVPIGIPQMNNSMNTPQSPQTSNDPFSLL